MNQQDELNNNLQEACVFEDIDAVTIYVERGADVTVDDNCAVRSASYYGDLDMVKYLVSVGADITADNNYALRWASENGHLDTVEYLVSQGAVLINKEKNMFKLEQDFERACKNNNLHEVEIVLDYLDNISERCTLGFGIAVVNNHIDIVKYLLKCGYIPGEKDTSAFIATCRVGNLEVLNLLVETRAFCDRTLICTNYAPVEFNERILYVLNQYNINISYRYQESKIDLVTTPEPKAVSVNTLNEKLVLACQNGNLKEINKLIKKGADLTHDLCKPITEAIICDHPTVVKYLLPLHGDVACDIDILMVAVGRCHYLGCVIELVNFGIGITEVSIKTGIQEAVSNNNATVLNYFLLTEIAIKHNLVDYAMRVCCEEGSVEITSWLVEFGGSKTVSVSCLVTAIKSDNTEVVKFFMDTY